MIIEQSIFIGCICILGCLLSILNYNMVCYKTNIHIRRKAKALRKKYLCEMILMLIVSNIYFVYIIYNIIENEINISIDTIVKGLF
mgnify:FL=1